MIVANELWNDVLEYVPAIFNDVSAEDSRNLRLTSRACRDAVDFRDFIYKDKRSHVEAKLRFLYLRHLDALELLSPPGTEEEVKEIQWYRRNVRFAAAKVLPLRLHSLTKKLHRVAEAMADEARLPHQQMMVALKCYRESINLLGCLSISKKTLDLKGEALALPVKIISAGGVNWQLQADKIEKRFPDCRIPPSFKKRGVLLAKLFIGAGENTVMAFNWGATKVVVICRQSNGEQSGNLDFEETFFEVLHRTSSMLTAQEADPFFHASKERKKLSKQLDEVEKLLDESLHRGKN